MRVGPATEATEMIKGQNVLQYWYSENALKSQGLVKVEIHIHRHVRLWKICRDVPTKKDDYVKQSTKDGSSFYLLTNPTTQT